MIPQLSVNNNETVQVNSAVLQKLLEFAEAVLKGDYSKRVITDFSDDLITRVSTTFNRFADKMQLNQTSAEVDHEDTVSTFMDVISSYTNLDFKQKLPISENGTIWDAIATGINMLGDELEQSTTSRQELERERNLLKEAKRQAEEANVAKGRFLANMSHEIRTPLNGVLGLTQVLMNEVTNPDHLKYLEMIHYSGKNLTQIINDILDFSKIESGKLELEKLNFNFRKIINNEIERYRFLAMQKGLYLTCEIDSAVPQEVIGDQVRISQVVNNLIGNSIKFTSEGGINVKFSLLKSKKDEAMIQCMISDTGIGIAKEAQTRIFQSFDQADTSVTRKYGGTGLGLSIVKSLVEVMGGAISVQSPFNPTLNNGSCFTFTLLLNVPTSKVSGASEAFTKKELKNTIQVLVVDDNPVNLLVARKMIEKFGAKAITVDNGADAIKLANGKEFDLILMDLQMPQLDGFATVREIRKMNYRKPIIALSASAYREDIDNSLEAGMNGHLHKPFTESELFEVIENNS